MSIRTEQKLLDFGKWWEFNKGSITDVKKNQEFLEKAVTSLAHIYIDIAEDIKILEGRGTVGKAFDKIITPDNVLGRN